MQQEFCHLQKLSTHKGNNNYNCVQSNKNKGTVYQTGMPSPCFALRVNELAHPQKLFCAMELLYQLPSLLFLFIRFEMQ